jgi:hypothetical protein
MKIGGDVFPGDCVIFQAEAVTVSQASLTGELMPVEKSPRSELPSPLYRFDLLDNVNVCLAGTSVATGSGRALVISTGGETYLASIAKDLTKMRPLNSMQIGIRKVSYLLMAFMVVSLLHLSQNCPSSFKSQVMAPTVFVIQGAISKNWKDAVFFAISVGVGLTPGKVLFLPLEIPHNFELPFHRDASHDCGEHSIYLFYLFVLQRPVNPAILDIQPCPFCRQGCPQKSHRQAIRCHSELGSCRHSLFRQDRHFDDGHGSALGFHGW